jgi:hypothetical protein
MEWPSSFSHHSCFVVAGSTGAIDSCFVLFRVVNIRDISSVIVSTFHFGHRSSQSCRIRAQQFFRHRYLCAVEQRPFLAKYIIDISYRLSDMMTTAVENRDQMTTEETTLQLQVQTTAPRASEIPKLDERLWQAWLEKNEKRDKILNEICSPNELPNDLAMPHATFVAD